MISLDEVRTVVTNAFKTLHTTSYPAIPVNYAGIAAVDLENYTGSFFVNFEIEYGQSVGAAGLGDSGDEVDGQVYITTCYKAGVGMPGSGAYSDMLKNNFNGKVVNGVNFTNMKILSTSPFKGYNGRMNVFKFKVLG